MVPSDNAVSIALDSGALKIRTFRLGVLAGVSNIAVGPTRDSQDPIERTLVLDTSPPPQ
jgi:hypothetical protein